jgi:hypothetical protein
VLCIRDIFVRIRIRIRVSVPLSTDPDPDPDPTLFLSGFQESTILSFFASYFTFERVFEISKVKSHKKSHKTIEIKVLLTFLLDDGRIQ